jgi:hypothetical protein
MSETILQTIQIVGGVNDGRLATVSLPLPFSRKQQFVIDGKTYKVADSPIARKIEESQAAFDNVAILFYEMDEEISFADFESWLHRFVPKNIADEQLRRYASEAVSVFRMERGL